MIRLIHHSIGTPVIGANLGRLERQKALFLPAKWLERIVAERKMG